MASLNFAETILSASSVPSMTDCNNLLAMEDDPIKLARMIKIMMDDASVCTREDDWVSMGRVLLMMAAKLGREKCCAVILSACPSALHEKNSRGYNALHLSSYSGHQDTSLLLLSSGINCMDLNKYGETCDEAAMSGGNLALACMMRSETILPNRSSCMMCPGTYASVSCDSTSSTKWENFYFLRRCASNQWNDLPPCAQFEYTQKPLLEMDTDAVPINNVIFGRTKDEDNFKRYSLEIVHGEPGVDTSLVGLTFDLGGTDVSDVFIGRGGSNPFQIKDLSISKQHAVISFHSGLGFYVRDLGSIHGTYVDGQKLSSQTCLGINRNVLLTEDSVLKLGRVSLVLKRRQEPSVLSKSFVPNPSTGILLIQEAKRRHALESLEAAKNKKRHIVEETDKWRQHNRDVINLDSKKRDFEGNEKNGPSDGTTGDTQQQMGEQSEFGSSMLRKMGWAPGKGLGKNESGMSGFVQVHARLARAGVGMKNTTANCDEGVNNQIGQNRAKIRKITEERFKKAMS